MAHSKLVTSSPSGAPDVLHDLFGLSGKTAIVLGGTGGLGQVMTLALAEAGADIVSIELPNDPQSASLQTAVERVGRKIQHFNCDIADRRALRETFARMWDAGIEADILLNSAGVQRRGPVEKISDEDLDVVIDINFKSTYVAAQEFGSRLVKEGRKGKIINIASINSYIANHYISPYAASKGAVLQATKALSNEWSARGINVNCICPGFMQTALNKQLLEDPMFKGANEYIIGRTPAGRWGAPEELRGAVLFLAGSASDYVCGASIVVDGGVLGK